MLSTNIIIESIEEYEAICALSHVLIRFGVSQSKTLAREIWAAYDHKFERCDRCDEALEDCGGHDDDPVERNIYDDGDSFED